jgi:large subunit ribosomal protein L31
MKKDIHPTFHMNTSVTCACGNAFTTGATTAAIETELCSKCHPFYTGKQKLVDTAKRVDRFEKRAAKKDDVGSTRSTKREKRSRDAVRRAEKAEKIPPSEE